MEKEILTLENFNEKAFELLKKEKNNINMMIGKMLFQCMLMIIGIFMIVL